MITIASKIPFSREAARGFIQYALHVWHLYWELGNVVVTLGQLRTVLSSMNSNTACETHVMLLHVVLHTFYITGMSCIEVLHLAGGC